MNRRITIAALALFLALPVMAAERLNDREVKALIEKIDQTRDRFEDQLDGELKRSTLRNANGEVNIGQFLEDFQGNIDRLKERLSDDNAASREAEIVLNQASAIDGFLQRHPAETKGRSEWNQLAGDFRTLASAYGAKFPIGPTDKANRINDRELATTADLIKTAAERLDDSLDNELGKVPAVTKPARQAMVGEAKQLAKDADALRGRVNDRQPSSAEASRLLQRAGKVDGFLKTSPAPQSSNAFASIKTHLQKVATAYQLPWP
jgi:hypothetical protein